MPGAFGSVRIRARHVRLALALAPVLILAGAVVVVVTTHTSTPGPAATYVAPALRQRVELNTGWKFTRADVSDAQAVGFDDSSWSNVDVAHTWNAIDGADGGNDYYRGIGWYRHHAVIAAPLGGKMFFLEFAGVNQVADVWVNGVHLGQHQGGYSRFRFGATTAVRVGQDNVIAVRVSNAHNPDIAPLSADFTFGGGIYRPVTLWAVDPLQVRMLDHAGPGVYLRQRDVTAAAATVDVTTKLFNNHGTSRSVAVRAVVTDAAGAVVADQTEPARTVTGAAGVDVAQTFTIVNPRRWDGLADPYLYRVNVEIRDVGANRVTDAVTEPLGLRSFSIDVDTGFALNGRPLRLRGVNLHQDRADAGWAVNDTQHTEDMALIREIGANAVRMAHYQHDQKDYTLADEMGFVVWAEIPLIDNITGSPGFAASTEQQLRELIRQNYNHPSIVFWGIGNEQHADDTATNGLLDHLAGVVNTEDPDRLSTYASCCVSETGAVNGHVEAPAYNKYFGWYYGSYDDLGAWADGLHAAAPSRPFAVSEYGAGANITQHALNPRRPSTTGPSHPEEYQALLHEASWKQLDARPYVWGSFVWNMFDFASDGRDEGAQPGINDKGLVTRDRVTRKDAFYWYKANWAPTPTLHIASRRWTQRSAAATEIKVYSNAATVSATLNGASLGTLSSADRIFQWTDVTLRPGQNTVTATATIDGATHTDTVTWAHLP